MADKVINKTRQITTFISPEAYQVIKIKANDYDLSIKDMTRKIIENELKKDIKKLNLKK